MKKITTLLLALLLVIPAMAKTMTGGEVLYLKTDGNTKWNSDGAWFAAYFFGSGNTWVSMTKVAGETADIYEVTVPNGSWTNVIFCRMNPISSSKNWNNKWNQTGNLVYDGTKNLFTPSGWDNATTTWSTYTPPVIETPTIKSFTVSPKTVLLGGEITLSSSIENSKDAVVYSVGGKTITSPWTPTAVGTYTITASLTGAESKTAKVEVVEIPEGVVFYEGETAAFFINSGNWTSVNAYVWNGSGDNTWPGVACGIAGGNFYKWTGSVDWEENAPEKIIFNNGNGSQTPDMTFENGAIYTTSGEMIGYIEPTVVEQPTISLSYSPTKIYVGDVVTFTSNVLHGDGLTVEYYVGEEKLDENTWTATAAGVFTATAKLMNGTTVVASDSKTFTVVRPTTEFYAYLMKDGAWETTYIYYWDGADVSNTWPGTLLENTVTIDGAEYYKFAFRDVATVNIVFNNGVDKPQTSDIENVTATTYYRITNQNGGEGSYEASATPFVEEQPETLIFTVTVPEGTENCYIVGNFTGSDSDWKTPLAMEAIGDVQYTIVIDGLIRSAVQYKYLTNADVNANIWDNVEVADENDADLENNRSYKEEDVVVKWKGIALLSKENIECESKWYLNTNGLWTSDNAWFAAYFFNKNTNQNAWVKGELIAPEYYVFYLSQYNVPEYAAAPARAMAEETPVYTHVIFCRMNPDFNTLSWDVTEVVDNGDGSTTTNVLEDHVWNQTADLTYDGSKNTTFQINTADGEGNWKVLPTAVESVKVANGIVYANGVVTAEGAIEVYNVGGAVVARGNNNVDLNGLNGGVYIVRNGNNVCKVVR